MFEIIERLYDIKIILNKDAFVNSKDNFLDTVAFYEIYKNDILISYFMIDPYNRQEKRSGAWANNLRGKEKNKLPLIINVYNIQQSE
jgi:Zn-dependent oligopeptidase